MIVYRIVVAACLFALFSKTTPPQSFFGTSCGEDVQIQIDKRKAIDAAAANFASSLFGPNPGIAYDALTDGGHQLFTRERVAREGQRLVLKFDPKNFKVQHTYEISLLGKSAGRVVCGSDLANPVGWESLGAVDVFDQAHVLMSADSTNNHLAFTVWLVSEKGEWKIEGFWMNVSSLAEEDSIRLWDSARIQKARGHSFNAALLLSAAAQTANRGPNFQLGIERPIKEDLAKLEIPLEIKGQLPFRWKGDNMTFNVFDLSPVAVGSKIYVLVLHDVAPWRTSAQVERWNRLVVDYVKRQFPEYSDAFAGIVVQAREQGTNRLYSTVDASPTSK